MNPSVSGIMAQKFWDTRFLQCCFSIGWCAALFMSQHSISVWLMSGLCDWAIVTPRLFSSSVILLYLGCCVRIIVLLNEPLSVKLLAVWQMTSHLTLGSKCDWRPRACSQIITPPLPCSAVFCDDMLFQFCQMWHSSQSRMVQGRPVHSMLTAIVSLVLGFASIHAVWFYLSGFTVFGQIWMELQNQPDSDFKEHIVTTKWKKKEQSRLQTL